MQRLFPLFDNIQIPFIDGIQTHTLLIDQIRLSIDQNLYLADSRQLRQGIHNGVDGNCLCYIVSLLQESIVQVYITDSILRRNA